MNIDMIETDASDAEQVERAMDAIEERKAAASAADERGRDAWSALATALEQALTETTQAGHNFSWMEQAEAALTQAGCRENNEGNAS